MKGLLIGLLVMGAVGVSAGEIAFNCRINADFKDEFVSVPSMTGIDYILGTQFSNDSLEGCIQTAKTWQSDIAKHELNSKVKAIEIRYLHDDVDFNGKIEIK